MTIKPRVLRKDSANVRCGDVSHRPKTMRLSPESVEDKMDRIFSTTGGVHLASTATCSYYFTPVLKAATTGR